MRGDAERQTNIMLAVTPETFVPADRPIRRIKPIVDAALQGVPVGHEDDLHGLGLADASGPRRLLRAETPPAALIPPATPAGTRSYTGTKRRRSPTSGRSAPPRRTSWSRSVRAS